MEEDLLVGHSVTSAGGLREIVRKIGVGEREHSCVLTSFVEASSSRTPRISRPARPHLFSSSLFLIDRNSSTATHRPLLNPSHLRPFRN
jgi:hypothetical protein